jgi:hypothetical protein
MKPNTRNRIPFFLGVFLAALIGCGIGCTIAMKMASSDGQPRKGDSHDWLHEQLEITPEQTLKLEVIEERFAERESNLREALFAANRVLGQVIKEERTYTPRVASSVEMIHHAMADLQKATLEHLFEMEEVLTEEQYDRLLQLAGDALADDPLTGAHHHSHP